MTSTASLRIRTAPVGASRQHNHDMRNLARMLTPEERRAKNAAKMAEDTSLEAHVAVFYVADLSCGRSASRST